MSDNTPDEIKSKAWNEAITPRLDSLRAYMARPEWVEGLAAYWKNMVEHFLDVRLSGGSSLTRDQEKFIDGQIAAFRELLAFPSVIDRHIAGIEKKKKQADGVNPKSGY